MERLSAEMACYINVPVTTDSCALAEDTRISFLFHNCPNLSCVLNSS